MLVKTAAVGWKGRVHPKMFWRGESTRSVDNAVCFCIYQMLGSCK